MSELKHSLLFTAHLLFSILKKVFICDLMFIFKVDKQIVLTLILKMRKTVAYFVSCIPVLPELYNYSE